MKSLIAMDCDGCVETPDSAGPIKLEQLMELSKKHDIFIIGDSKLKKHIDLPLSGEVINIPSLSGISYPGGKSMALMQWRIKYPTTYQRYIVVDDKPQQYMGWFGWEFMLPDEFVRRIQELL
jgi:hypothetical protein